jgi:hypothetical protein
VFFEQEILGDLAYKVDDKPACSVVAWIRHAGAQLLHDNRIESRGSIVITECPDADTGTCVLVGDSYSWALLKFLSESFRRLVFIQHSVFDFDFIAAQEPEVVINP